MLREEAFFSLALDTGTERTATGLTIAQNKLGLKGVCG
jgi:hypothetical protein